MSQRQYLDSLYKNEIEIQWFPDTVNIHNFVFHDAKGKHKATIKAEIKSIFENDSLKGVLVDLTKYPRGYHCAGTLTQPHLIGMMEELYTSKYGNPTQRAKSGEGNVLYWNLDNIDLYIDSYPGYCLNNGKFEPAIANFTISYFDKKFATAFKLLFNSNSEYYKPNSEHKYKPDEAI